MATNDVPDDAVVAELRSRLETAQAERAQAQDEIERYTAAIAALTGERQDRRSYRGTTGTAIVAALTTFAGPVSSETLLDHSSLAHYSRHTLRGALSQLKKDGRIQVAERTNRGYIWQPPGADAR